MKTVSVALMAVLLTACSRSAVEIQNTASAPIANINIQVAGNDLSIARLDPGASRRVGYSTKTEDAIAVSFQINGALKKCSAPIYVSPPFEDEFTVRILPDGKCTISRKQL